MSGSEAETKSLYAAEVSSRVTAKEMRSATCGGAHCSAMQGLGNKMQSERVR